MEIGTIGRQKYIYKSINTFIKLLIFINLLWSNFY